MGKLINLTPAEARASAELGECIALPGWKGFWFFDNYNNKMMAVDQKNKVVEIVANPEVSNEWMEVVPNEKQEKALEKYFKLVKPFEEVKEVKLTLGEEAVGLTFDSASSEDPDIFLVRKTCANMIDWIEQKHTQYSQKESPSWTRNVFRTAAFNAIIAAKNAMETYIKFTK